MIECPRFVFAADLHLQVGAWTNRTEIAGDSVRSFRQIIRYCRQYNVPLVLGGDIFDKKRPEPAAVQAYLEGAAELAAIRQSIFFVQGDHDYWPTQPWPALAVNAVPLHKNPQQLGNWVLQGLDWTPMNLLKQSLETLRDFPQTVDFLVMHQAWAELQRIGTTEGSLADIPFACRLLTGDYHQHMSTYFQDKDILAVSAGSTCLQAIDESPTKAVYLFSEQAGAVLNQSLPLYGRPVFRCMIRELSDMPQLDCGVSDALREAQETANRLTSYGIETTAADVAPLIRVTYTDTLDIKAAVERICSGCHIFWNPQRVVSETYVDYEAAVNRGSLDAMVTAIDEFEPAGSQTNNDLRQLLLAGGNFAEAILAMEQEALA